MFYLLFNFFNKQTNKKQKFLSVISNRILVILDVQSV